MGISQSELSEKLGTSQQTISRIEKARIENIPCNLLIKLADIFHVPVDILIYEEKNNLFSSQGEELWEIYKQLDEANKTTLLTLGRRLSEAQVENMFKRQMGDESDKNSDMWWRKMFYRYNRKNVKSLWKEKWAGFYNKKYTKPLQLMESLKEEFQIFFLDIEMPAMDGMELVDIIRKHDEKSIVLFCVFA